MIQSGMNLNVNEQARPTHLWVIAGSALIAAVIGSLVAALLDLTVVPSGTVGSVPGLFYSGLPASFLAFFFGVPIAGLVASSIAYTGVVLRRPVVLSIVAVIAGTIAGALVGLLVPALGRWWLSLPSDTSQTASILTVVVVLLLAPALTLSVKLPIIELVRTRRGRVASVLAVAALSGLLIGLFVGGVAAGVTALQNPCNSPGSACLGLSVPDAISGGSLLGAWFGAGAGLVGGALGWAVPPWQGARK
jgi:hypothetical protein